LNKPNVSPTEVSSIPSIIIKNGTVKTTVEAESRTNVVKRTILHVSFFFPIKLPPNYERDHPNLNKNL